MQKPLTRNPLVIFATFLVVLSGLLYIGADRTDVVVRVLIWSVVITTSIIAVALALWRGRGPYSMNTTLPDRLRRWVMDEDGDED